MVKEDGSWRTLQDALALSGIEPGARLLIAVSGGPDSLALLAATYSVAHEPAHRWTLRIGHVNHTLRGEESDADEQFVRSLAERWNIEIDVASVDTAGYARSRKISLELAARQLRGRALERISADWNADHILVAHSADDQAVTVLQRLLRGAGLSGLGAIHQSDHHIVRPFLGIRRAVILNALQAHGLESRADSSNWDRRFQRNRLRHEVLPVLEAFQPRLVEVLGRTAGLLQDDDDFIQREARQALAALNVSHTVGTVSAGRAAWSALHPTLRAATLRLLLLQLLGDIRDIHEAHIREIASALEGANDGFTLVGRLPRNLALYVSGGQFTLSIVARSTPAPFAPVELPTPGSVDMPFGRITATIDDAVAIESARAVTVCGPFNALCDLGHLEPPLMVRTRKPGDRMRPIGAPGTRKLQDLLVDRKVPRHFRDHLPVVEDADGLVWVPGIALDHKVAINSESERILHLRYQPEDWSSVLESLSNLSL